MKKLTLTEDDIIKIIELNAKLKEQEQRIKQFANSSHLTLGTQKSNKEIDCYNFDTYLQVFSNNKASYKNIM